MTFYTKYLADFKEGYLGYIPLSIIFQSCLGSIAAMYIISNSTIESFPFIQLGLCVIASMIYNAAVLIQLNYKLVFNLFLSSIITNAILIGLSFVFSF